MNTPTGNEIINFVLYGPAGRDAGPQHPDKRRATADEVEKFIYGGKPLDWAHYADIASAAREHLSMFRHLTPDEDELFQRLKEERYADDDYDGPGTPGMSEQPGG